MLFSKNVFKEFFFLRISVFVLVSLHVLPTAAQTSLPLTRTVADSIAQAAREDTTYALQRLFHENRHRYRSKAALWGAWLGSISTYSTLVTFHQSGQTEQKVTNIAGIALSGSLFVRSLVMLHYYRSGREKKLIATLEAGKPLPYKMRRQLKPGYFDTQTNSK